MFARFWKSIFLLSSDYATQSPSYTYPDESPSHEGSGWWVPKALPVLLGGSISEGSIYELESVVLVSWKDMDHILGGQVYFLGGSRTEALNPVLTPGSEGGQVTTSL